MYLNQTSHIGWERVHVYVPPFIILVYQVRAFVYYIPNFTLKFCCKIVRCTSKVVVSDKIFIYIKKLKQIIKLMIKVFSDIISYSIQ